MSILRKNINSVKPSLADSPRPSFYRTSKKMAIKKIYDEHGKVISERETPVCVREIIPQEEFENKGVLASMFSIANLEAAGIEPKLITTPLFRSTLDNRSEITEAIEGFDFETIVENKSGSSEPSTEPTSQD